MIRSYHDFTKNELCEDKKKGEHSIRALTISIEQIHLWYRQC